jgi:hypothetical protein
LEVYNVLTLILLRGGEVESLSSPFCTLLNLLVRWVPLCYEAHYRDLTLELRLEALSLPVVASLSLERAPDLLLAGGSCFL